jgi:hypothetical protein
MSDFIRNVLLIACIASGAAANSSSRALITDAEQRYEIKYGRYDPPTEARLRKTASNQSGEIYQTCHGGTPSGHGSTGNSVHDAPVGRCYGVDPSTPSDDSRFVRHSVSQSFCSKLAYSDRRHPTAHLLLMFTRGDRTGQQHQGKNKKTADDAASQKNK